MAAEKYYTCKTRWFLSRFAPITLPAGTKCIPWVSTSAGVYKIPLQPSVLTIWGSLVHLWRKWHLDEVRSWGQYGSFWFSCPYVRMQWVPHYGHIGHTCSSILWYVLWQDWTRFSTSRFNFNICCTPADCCAHPNTQIKTADPRMPHERIHFPTPKLPEIHTNRFNRDMVSKYPKLWCIPCRRDTHICLHRVWAPFYFGEVKHKFWEDVVALRLMRTWTQQHDHTIASQ
jgi:hypothetical protein